MDWFFLLGLRGWLRHFYLFLGSHTIIYKYNEGSQLVGLDELFTHPQEVVLLMGGLLDYIEEGVLHDDLRCLQELVTEEEVLVVGIVALCLTLELLRNLHQ